MKRLRLVKVIVQPVFVVDDGESLNELIPQAVTVSAADWPGFATGAFIEATAALELQVAGDQLDKSEIALS